MSSVYVKVASPENRKMVENSKESAVSYGSAVDKKVVSSRISSGQHTATEVFTLSVYQIFIPIYIY